MADIAFEKDLSVAETGIGGLKVVDLAVHGDSRGWFSSCELNPVPAAGE